MNHYKQKKSTDGYLFTTVVWHSLSLKYLDFNNKKVLDIGAGSGGFLRYIKQKYNSDVYGLDPNPENVKSLKTNNIKAYHGFAVDFLENTELKDRFDVVTSFEVLEHIYSDKDIFLPAYTFLKKDGVFIVSTPNAFHILRLFSMFFGDHRDILMDPSRSEEPEHIRLYSYNMIKRSFAKFDFKNIKIFGIIKFMNKEIVFKNRFLINYFAQHLVGLGEK